VVMPKCGEFIWAKVSRWFSSVVGRWSLVVGQRTTTNDERPRT
jgi:hypothetical protein